MGIGLAGRGSAQKDCSRYPLMTLGALKEGPGTNASLLQMDLGLGTMCVHSGNDSGGRT